MSLASTTHVVPPLPYAASAFSHLALGSLTITCAACRHACVATDFVTLATATTATAAAGAAEQQQRLRHSLPRLHSGRHARVWPRCLTSPGADIPPAPRARRRSLHSVALACRSVPPRLEARMQLCQQHLMPRASLCTCQRRGASCRGDRCPSSQRHMQTCANRADAWPPRSGGLWYGLCSRKKG